MPSDSSPDLLVDESPVSRRTSSALAIIACAALLGDCLLTSPARFSALQQHDTSVLSWVVWLSALGGRFPTTRGVEIRNLVFYVAAALMALLAGARLVLSKARPRMSEEDLWDVRSRAAGPYFWWCLLLLSTVVSSWYSHAPSVCEGQTIARFLQVAWWWPLAALLAPRHVRLVASSLFTALAITAAVGIWYHVTRVLPGNPSARLQYPIGNELWFAACLLPGVFIALGLIAARPKPIRMAATVLGLLAILFALFLTRSRSAAAGLVAGFAVVVFFLIPARWRKPFVLSACLIGIAATLFIQRQVAAGLQAHSIRSRIIYEWPYALNLFSQKPIGGHGDGAYCLLAGQFARDDQIDDPAILRSDESFWTGHAHNEFLELLADLGILGALAFAAALATTLYHAFRSASASSPIGAALSDRWLVIGLSAALAASVVEACGTPSIREPGATPIFLTVWACLWALVRRHRPPLRHDEKEKPFGSTVLRMVGLLVAIGAGALGWYGIQDWRGARARFEAAELMNQKQFSLAAHKADFAAAHLLDPFQNCLARMVAVWARSLEFDRRLADSAGPPSNADLEIAQEAMARASQLDHDAPNFLRMSRLEAELYLNCSRAFERRGDRANRDEYHAKFIAALEQSRADEPFQVDRVMALWNAEPTASAMDRLNWLRALIRVGEMDRGFLQLFRQLDHIPGFAQTLEGFYQIACRDEARPPDQWKDRLAPETLRLAALAKALSNTAQGGLDAAHLADRAVALYAKAGPRLFAGRAAALHESVRYRFAAEPTAETDANLERLAQAHGIQYGSVSSATPLREALGDTRLNVLLAAGRERDAAAQIAVLHPEDKAPPPVQLARAYADLAAEFAENPSRYPLVERWCHRAAELAPLLPDPYAVLIRSALTAKDDTSAANAAEQILRLEKDRTAAAGFLTDLRRRYPDRTFWRDIARRYPEVAAPPTSSPALKTP